MLLQDVVKGALILIMCVFNIRNIKWNGACFFGLWYYLIKRNIHYFSIRIYGALDEPGAGYPVNFRAFTGDPLHAELVLKLQKRLLYRYFNKQGADIALLQHILAL